MGIAGVEAPATPAEDAPSAPAGDAPEPVAAELGDKDASSAASASSSETASDSDNEQCSLLGPFALVVQGSLGLLALVSLVFKRWRERPRRPLKIWFFDVSKQVFGSALLHVFNVFMSIVSSGAVELSAQAAASKAADDWKPNPCSFYLINIAVDVSAPPDSQRQLPPLTPSRRPLACLSSCSSSKSCTMPHPLLRLPIPPSRSNRATTAHLLASSGG